MYSIRSSPHNCHQFSPLELLLVSQEADYLFRLHHLAYPNSHLHLRTTKVAILKIFFSTNIVDKGLLGSANRPKICVQNPTK